jgi:hypothetical protein
MGWKEEWDFHKYRKAEKEATRRRRVAQKEGMVCVVCGKSWYEHDSFGDIEEHRKSIMEGKQWVKK